VLPQTFKHQPPEGYSYEQSEFKRNVIAIWILHQRRFDYNNGAPVRCIWGFYNTKTKSYHSPVNSSTVGSVVSIEQTTPYSAMQLHLNPLAYVLYS
jgi:hypothetical protein